MNLFLLDHTKQPNHISNTSMQSLKDYVFAFADQQTYERLKQCGDIEDALNECERIRKLVELQNTKKKKQLSASELSPQHRLSDTRAGMRIARFYDWGLSNPRAEEALAAMRDDSAGVRSIRPSEEVGKEAGVVTSRNEFVPESCSMERHAVWGCRAMALGCANELVKLKKCFVEKHGDTNPQYFAYENSDGVSKIDACEVDMQILGRCVSQNWKELDERLK
jgi:hypothetical protein